MTEDEHTWKDIFETLKILAKTNDEGVYTTDLIGYDAKLKDKNSGGIIFGKDKYDICLTLVDDSEIYELRKNGDILLDAVRHMNKGENNTYHCSVYHEKVPEVLNILSNQYLEGYKRINHD